LIEYLNLCNVGEGEITDESIKAIANGCRNIKLLNICNCKQITDDSIKLLAKQCSLLQNIDISFCNKITDEAIEHLTALCPHLTEINTRGCSVETISSSIKLMSSKSKDVKKKADTKKLKV
jgi:bacterioferritin-associated ferredoxin